MLDTYAVRTGSGGLHLYFRASETAELRNTAGQLGWLIDTRAAGGYVVGAGSIVRGRRYELLNDREPAPLPGWIAGRLTAPSPAATAHSAWELLRRGADKRTRYANAALTAEVQRVLEAGEGTRNDTLVRAAFALGQLVGAGVLPDDLVTEALTAAGQAIGLSPRECAATIASGLRSGRARPRGGAA